MFGPKVSRGRPRSELRVEGFQNCCWLVCSTGSTPQVTAVMPEISAPPSSSSVCLPPQFPDGIQLRLREGVASTRQEGGPSESAEGVRVGSEGRRVRSDRVGEGSTGFEGRGSRVSTEGFRDSAPAASASGADAATGARGRVCGSDGGGGTHATEGQEGEGQERERGPGCQGSREGQHRQAERREGQRQRAQGCEGWCRQGRHQCADGEKTAEAATHEGRSEGQRVRTERTECALQASGTWTGQGRGCEPGAEALAVGEENSPETAGGRHAEQPPAWKKVDGLSKTTTGDKAEGDDPGPKHADPRSANGDGPLGETPEAGSRSEVVCPALERHNSPNQYEARFPQVDLSIAAGRAEVTTRAVVVIADKTSYTSPMPTHRQHPPPPPPPTGATGEQGGTAASGSPSSFSMVTRCPEDAGCSNSSPGDTRSIDTAKNDAERQQEGKDLGGVGGESKGFARSGANGCGVGFSTGVPAADQIGGTNHGQGGSSSEGQDVFPGEPSASSWGVLGRSLGEDG